MQLDTCRICGRISGSGGDHLDCTQRARIESADEEFKEALAERLGDSGDLGVEIRALLEHIEREKDSGNS